MLKECLKTCSDKPTSNTTDRLALNPDQLAELSASLHQYFSSMQNGNSDQKTAEHLMNEQRGTSDMSLQAVMSLQADMSLSSGLILYYP